jgi:hypothetical protein
MHLIQWGFFWFLVFGAVGGVSWTKREFDEERKIRFLPQRAILAYIFRPW